MVLQLVLAKEYTLVVSLCNLIKDKFNEKLLESGK